MRVKIVIIQKTIGHLGRSFLDLPDAVFRLKKFLLVKDIDEKVRTLGALSLIIASARDRKHMSFLVLDGSSKGRVQRCQVYGLRIHFTFKSSLGWRILVYMLKPLGLSI